MKNVISIYDNSGFTFIESLIYMLLIVIMLSALIPLAWNVIEGGSQSAVQQDVNTNARFISQRLQLEIRSASGINSVSTNSISLSEANSATNPTVITWSSPNLTIQQGSGSVVQLNSSTTSITNFLFTNNSSADNKTKNIYYNFTIQQSNPSSSRLFNSSITVESTAELRSN